MKKTFIKTIFCSAIAATLFACDSDSSTSPSNDPATGGQGAVQDTSITATNATTNPLGDSSSVNTTGTQTSGDSTTIDPTSGNQGEAPATDSLSQEPAPQPVKFCNINLVKLQGYSNANITSFLTACAPVKNCDIEALSQLNACYEGKPTVEGCYIVNGSSAEEVEKCDDAPDLECPVANGTLNFYGSHYSSMTCEDASRNIYL